MSTIYRTNKITRILTLYYQLANGKHIDKSSFSIEHGVSERGFDRDIEDIRLFLSEMFLSNEVVFDKTNNTYYLTGSKPKYMDKAEATVILKLVLSAGAFRLDEMNGIFNSILQTVNDKDRNTIKNYLKADRERYKSKHESAILKTLGDLYIVTNSENDIEVLYYDDKNKLATVKVSPLEVEYNGKFFNLIGAKNFDLSEIIKIRIDKINSYKIQNTNYTKHIKSKYTKLKEE